MPNLKNNYAVQVLDGHYTDNTYLSISRWSTYSQTIEQVLQLRPKTILEIGPGPGVVTAALRKMGFSVKTLDMDESLQPDYHLSITDKNIETLLEKFDLIIASEIFEHIHYPDFLTTLEKLRGISNRLLITLPDTNKKSLFFAIRIRLPVLNKIIFSFKFRFKRVPHIFDSQHYWEIGKQQFPLRKIIRDIGFNGWLIKKSFINIDNPYHRFILLEKK